MDEVFPPPQVELPKRSFLGSGVFLMLFFILTPIALAVSAFSLMTVSEKSTIEKQQQVLAAQVSARNVPRYSNIYSPAESTIPKVSASVEVADARVEIINQYLKIYQSPLANVDNIAEIIVSEADSNSLDFRLITAIAQQESNLCKKIPPDTFNCWGWGIHSAGTLGFSSYEEGVKTVSRGLKENYIDKGYNTPDMIMTKYTPMSNGSWANGVNQFMAEMQ